MPSSNLSAGAIGGISASVAVVLIVAIISFVYVYSLRLRQGKEGVYNALAQSEGHKELAGGRLRETNQAVVG